MLIGDGIEREQHVALFNHLVVLHLELDDAAAYLWCDTDYVGARERVVGTRVLIDEINDVDRDRNRARKYGETHESAHGRSPPQRCGRWCRTGRWCRRHRRRRRGFACLAHDRINPGRTTPRWQA